MWRIILYENFQKHKRAVATRYACNPPILTQRRVELMQKLDFSPPLQLQNGCLKSVVTQRWALYAKQRQKWLVRCSNLSPKLKKRLLNLILATMMMTKPKTQRDFILMSIPFCRSLIRQGNLIEYKKWSVSSLMKNKRFLKVQRSNLKNAAILNQLRRQMTDARFTSVQ